MTWWAPLYALSLYVWYYPKEWVEAVDIDSSVVGVPLERRWCTNRPLTTTRWPWRSWQAPVYSPDPSSDRGPV